MEDLALFGPQPVEGPRAGRRAQRRGGPRGSRGPRRTGISARGRRPPARPGAPAGPRRRQALGEAVREVQDDPLPDAHEGHRDLPDSGEAGQALVDDGRREDDVRPVLPQAQLAHALAVAERASWRMSGTARSRGPSPRRPGAGSAMASLGQGLHVAARGDETRQALRPPGPRGPGGCRRTPSAASGRPRVRPASPASSSRRRTEPMVWDSVHRTPVASASETSTLPPPRSAIIHRPRERSTRLRDGPEDEARLLRTADDLEIQARLRAGRARGRPSRWRSPARRSWPRPGSRVTSSSRMPPRVSAQDLHGPPSDAW